MDKHRLFITISIGLLLAFLTCGAVPGHAASQSAADTKLSRATADNLKERTERAQQRRKGRITQAQREAAAARAKAAREKSAPGHAVPITGEKEVLK